MNQNEKIRNIMRASPVMPVMVLEDVAAAVPLAQALVRGGIKVLEITMRTPVALDCVRAICSSVPEAIVGVGTITSPADLDAAIAAGAAFGVSPGATDALLSYAVEKQFALLPGVMTSSDVMRALQYGFTALKLFPAQQAGGIGMLKALGGPFPQVLFCPTGGIDVKTAPDFLALKNVACVGGSWLAPASMVAAGDWSGIQALAQEAAALKPN